VEPDEHYKVEFQIRHHHQHGDGCSGKSFQQLAFDALKENNFRITKSRLALIECLANTTVPLSPKSIFDSLINDYKIKIDQVSVYRILETFSQLNLVHQVFPSGDYLSCTTRCEHNSNHIILNCIKCSKVNEIHMDWNPIYKIFENVKEKFQFEPIKQMFQIDGICKQCR
jgi:Fe2+ or Zn2+ uptake regulation protein